MIVSQVESLEGRKLAFSDGNLVQEVGIDFFLDMRGFLFFLFF